jgi:hypothetical protein
MRAILFIAPLVALLACTGKDKSTAQGQGGLVEVGGAGKDSGGATASSGSTSAEAGGVNAGGNGGQGTGGNGGQETGGSGRQGTGGTDLVVCDLRKIACRVVQPSCPENQVPSVDGSCFGPCVPIESCACSAAQECPSSDRYTCWQRTHCGPYVR